MLWFINENCSMKNEQSAMGAVVREVEGVRLIGRQYGAREVEGVRWIGRQYGVGRTKMSDWGFAILESLIGTLIAIMLMEFANNVCQ